MPNNALLGRSVEGVKIFALVRPSTFAALLLISSICLYVYARKALKYHVISSPARRTLEAVVDR